MLSISRKESILRKAGYHVAAFPVRRLPLQERYFERNVRVPQEELDADRAHAEAVNQWRCAVERDYALYFDQRSAGPTLDPRPEAPQRR